LTVKFRALTLLIGLFKVKIFVIFWFKRVVGVVMVAEVKKGCRSYKNWKDLNT
jgi:hypothetical protein